MMSLPDGGIKHPAPIAVADSLINTNPENLNKHTTIEKGTTLAEVRCLTRQEMKQSWGLDVQVFFPTIELGILVNP